jgi:hypothetical protein
MHVILAMQEAEIRRIMNPSQPGQIVHETLSQKNPSQKRADRVAEGVGPESKLNYHTKIPIWPIIPTKIAFFL